MPLAFPALAFIRADGAGATGGAGSGSVIGCNWPWRPWLTLDDNSSRIGCCHAKGPSAEIKALGLRIRFQAGFLSVCGPGSDSCAKIPSKVTEDYQEI